MVIDLVIVTAPKPPGSRQSISPPAAVFEMAPANVLHGAVREHGLASSPTPEIHVLVPCPIVIGGAMTATARTVMIPTRPRIDAARPLRPPRTDRSTDPSSKNTAG